MNKKGFTLVELLATIIILSIVVGITIVGVNGGFTRAKEKTEDVFIKTLEDALNIYLNSNAKSLNFSNSETCTIQKRFGSSKIYANTTAVTFEDVISSDYTPLIKEDIVNPANEEVLCSIDAPVTIYRDTDYVYYYFINKADFQCLKTTGYITNLPCSCLNNLYTNNLPDRCNGGAN